MYNNIQRCLESFGINFVQHNIMTSTCPRTQTHTNTHTHPLTCIAQARRLALKIPEHIKRVKLMPREAIDPGVFLIYYYSLPNVLLTHTHAVYRQSTQVASCLFTIYTVLNLLLTQRLIYYCCSLQESHAQSSHP